MRKEMMKGMMMAAALVASVGITAQDMHFSNYNENPALVNPALTGVASNYRFGLIYKDQWRAVTVPYQTYGGYFDMRLKLNAWEKVNDHLTEIYKKAFRKLAAGLSFYSDRAGDGAMSNTRGDLSISTRVETAQYSFIAAGLQFGIVQRKVDFSKFIWPDQFVGTGYNTAVDPGESFNSSNFIHFDMAGGLLWAYDRGERGIRTNNELKADAGLAYYHITKPKQKWLNSSDERLLPKAVIHGKCLFGIKNSTLSLYPSFLVQFQGPSKEIMFGSLLRYKFKDDSKFTGYIKATHMGFGAHYRNRDALIVSGFMEFGTYSFGMSYDVNTSGLHPVTNYRGGFEVFLRFSGVTPFIYQNAASF